MKISFQDIFRTTASRSLAVIALLAGLCASYAATQDQKPVSRRKASVTVDSYTRPAPRKPVKPQIPKMSRNVPDKFFLEKAEVLYTTENDSTGKQVVSGEVMLSKQGAVLYCDSAYYYPASSSLEAFGNVKLIQGDTITVKADYANYDGLTDQVRLQTRGPGQNVSLEHVSKGTKTIKNLLTDNLDYSMASGEAIYRTGGRIVNRNMVNNQTDTLSSIIGTYNTKTRKAEVNENVFLRNAGSNLRTNRLLYFADSRVVQIVEPTTITSGSDMIVTSSGRYDVETGNALLSSRSKVTHKDKDGNVTTLEGDSMTYNNLMRITEAFMFDSPGRNGMPMVITDTARHAILIGGYGYYNDATKTAFADRYPLLKEYSRPDTIFLRAERVFLQTVNPGVKDNPALPDSLRPEPEYHVAIANNRARFFRSDIQGLADSITLVSRDSMVYLNRKPIVWSGERLVSGPEIQVHFNDSTPDWALLPRKGVVAEAIEDGFYNQLRAGYILANFTPEGNLDNILANTDVQTIFLPQEKDSTYNKMVIAYSDTLSVDMKGKEMSKLKLWSRQGAKVTGSVTPLMSVTKQQQYLPDFIAMAGARRFSEMESVLSRLDKLRPTYNVYRKGWSDDLGELSFELEDYFADPNIGIVDDAPVRNRPKPKPKPAASPKSEEPSESVTEEESIESVISDEEPEEDQENNYNSTEEEEAEGEYVIEEEEE